MHLTVVSFIWAVKMKTTWAGLKFLACDYFFFREKENFYKIWAISLERENRPRQAKECLRTCVKCVDLQHPAHTQKPHPGICYLLKHSVLLNDSDSGQWRPWSDCANAQADLGLLCPHMFSMSRSNYNTQTATVDWLQSPVTKYFSHNPVW